MSYITKINGANLKGAGGGQSKSAFTPQEDVEAPTGDAATLAAEAVAQNDTFPTDVYVGTDQRLETERTTLKNIFALSDVDVVAVESDDYDRDLTWYNLNSSTQVKPVAGDKVLIPQGISVNYDCTAGFDEAWIRVMGTLSVDVTADREISAETIYVDSGSNFTGKFEIGTAATPVPVTTTITWQPYNTGDIDTTNDRILMQRGFVSMSGSVEINAPYPVHRVRASVDPEIGDTTVTLDQPVQSVAGRRDWAIGDEIIIDGSILPNLSGGNIADTLANFDGWQTELRTITSIASGTTSAPVITLSSALSNDHPANPSNSSDKVCVSNLTRNVTLSPPDGEATKFYRRPHFLSKGLTDVKGLGMDFCGRTIHDQKAIKFPDTYGYSDYGWYDIPNERTAGSKNGVSKEKIGFWTALEFVNSKLIDVDNVTNDFTLLSQFQLVGSISGAIGVARAALNNGDGTSQLAVTVQSGTFVDGELIQCNFGTLGTYGSGTINGTPVNLPTTKSVSFAGRYGGVHLHRNGEVETFETTPLTVEGCVSRGSQAGWAFVHHDTHANFIRCVAYDFLSVGFAAEGGGNIGDWNDCHASTQAPVYAVMSDAAAKGAGTVVGSYGAAYWMNSRSLNIFDCTASNAQIGFIWNTRAGFGTRLFPGSLDIPRIFYGLPESFNEQVAIAFSPIVQFENCESYCNMYGLSISKAGPVQNHSARSNVKNFKCWETYNGVKMDYTAHYTFTALNATALRTPRTSKPDLSNSTCITFNNNTLDMVLSDPVHSGYSYFLVPYSNPSAFSGNRRKWLVVNPTGTATTAEYIWRNPNTEITSEITLPWTSPAGEIPDTYVDIRELATGDVGDSSAGAITWSPVIDEAVYAGGDFALIGNFTDSLGTDDRSAGIIPPSKHPGKNDYVQTQDDVVGGTTNNNTFCTRVKISQIFALMAQEGVYRGNVNADERILLIPDYMEDRYSAEPTLFYTPVALRISASEFNSVFEGEGISTWSGSALDNGVLTTDPDGVDWSTFNPSGTPGLI